MKNSRILIVDDEANTRFQITRWLHSKGYTTDEAENGEVALKKVEQSNFSVVLLDLNLPTIDGFKVLSQLNQYYPEICVIILTAYGDATTTQKALDAGAFDFFDKPIKYNSLLPRIESAIEKFNAATEKKYQVEEEQQKNTFDNIVGSSHKILNMLALVKKVAESDVPVLILGESGTGKELVARAIHYNSPRRNKSWIIADCSIITPTLIESELFGHEKGAFTNAYKRKIGKFERANMGTIFIDEIGELDQALQSKLLRFLQEGTIERVGSEHVIQINTRVLAATAVDLKTAIKEHRFREDLLFRLNVMTINIPPLRERKEDIPLLVDHCIKLYSRKNMKSVTNISASAIKLLMNYHFPGNVRELENIIYRAIVLTDGKEIKTEAIIFDPLISREPFYDQYFDLPIKEYVAVCEKKYIVNLLNKHNWHVIDSASAAGIDRSNLTKKMKKYGITKPR